MEFIDSTGHVFSLPTYNDKPVIYEYKENDYIFWLSNDKVSINNYFIKPIRFIIPIEEIFNDNELIEEFNINVKIESQFYRLIGPKTIQEKLEKVNNINEKIIINFDECYSTLSLSDFYLDEVQENNLIVENNGSKKYIMFPFYVIGKSIVEGTYLSNIFISVGDDISTEYTPITVGCTFIDECEELIINGKNMGINLPKDIIKAFYNSSFDSVYADEKILKDKMKELLMNYMSIKGECGNFKSVINSLKWFGWGNKIEISKLIKTDNEFIDQYILDYFSIDNDLKPSFKYFNTTNMISLSVKGNQETGENYLQNFDEMFIGEGNPIMEDLFKKNIEIKHDDISFYAPYYRFMMQELALKLDCLKYYYQNYFLPVHIKINRASINYKVYANKVKMSAIGLVNNTAHPIHVYNDNIIVKFPDTDEMIFYKTNHFIDNKFNEFSNYNEEYNEENLYNVYENNVFIPIEIIDLDNQYSKYEYGNYVKINEDYFKIYKLYKKDNGELIETDDLINAEVFSLSKTNDTLYSLSNYERYNKVSEGYFDCKLILTGTTIKQSNTGSYVYIDGEYKYKDKFYNKFIKDFNKDNSLYEDEKGNYIRYYNECIYVDPSTRYDIITTDLVVDNNFSFYQSGKQYYNGYVVLPRLLTKINKLDNTFDWLNTNFRLSLQVNNKWYYYDFKIILPSIYLDFGKLQYRYHLYDDTTMFKQLKSQTENDIKFNSFMYQPDLVSIDSFFYDKENKEMLTFIDKLVEINNKSANEAEEEKNMAIFYNNYFRNKIRIPYNKYYFNKVHLFKLYKNDGDNQEFKEIEYDGNAFNIGLYNAIFKDTKLNRWYLKEKIDYDVYLMHDSDERYTAKEAAAYNATLKGALSAENPLTEAQVTVYNTVVDGATKEVGNVLTTEEADTYNATLEGAIKEGDLKGKTPYWYIVFISRYPVGYYNPEDLVIKEENYIIDNSSNDGYKYKIKYTGYNIEKFLVNRMDIIKSNGYNHFNKNNLIITTVGNNDFQFNIDLSAKWEINKIDDINKVYKVNSNTNIAIITNNEYNGYYEPGYYNVELRYTINGISNHEYTAIGYYMVDKSDIEIIYPEENIFSDRNNIGNINDGITDFTILYSNKDGKLRNTIEILDPSEGYYPIAIRVVNAGYFTDDSPAIYIGLKCLDVRYPDTGYVKKGTINANYLPSIGFYYEEINDLHEYNGRSCKIDKDSDEYIEGMTVGFCPSDYEYYTKYESQNLEVPEEYIASNNRAYRSTPHIDILNDDDTLNTDMFDDTCAAFDWNGELNCQTIISCFGDDYNDWESRKNFTDINKKFRGIVKAYSNYFVKKDNNGKQIFYANKTNMNRNIPLKDEIQAKFNFDRKFSPAVACALRYHTLGTNVGDWHLPSYAEILFTSYNYKKYSDLIAALSKKYPQYCKPDLLTCISTNGIWSSTNSRNFYQDFGNSQQGIGYIFDIHPSYGAAHNVVKYANWYSIPYLFIK